MGGGEGSAPSHYNMQKELKPDLISTKESTIFEEDVRFESRGIKEESFFVVDDNHTSPSTRKDVACDQRNKDKLKFLREQYSSEADTTVVAEMQSVQTSDGGTMRFGGLLPPNYLEFNTKDGKIYYYNT